MRTVHAPLVTPPLLLSAVAVLAACAAAPSRDTLAQHGYRPWIESVDVALVAQGDPASLATAAMLMRVPAAETSGIDTAALDLVGRAATLAPTDRSIATMRLSICLATPRCDADSAAEALRRIDPENGLGHWATLSAAVTDKNPDAVDRAMKAMADSRSFDLYFNPTVIAAVEALARTGAPAEPGGRLHQDPGLWLDTAIGAFAAGIPPLQPLTRACAGAELPAVRRSYCLTTFATMRTADTLILQSLAASMTLRLTDAGSAQHAEAQAWRRTYHWRSLQIPQTVRPLRLRKSREESMRAMRMYRREEDSLRAVLTAFAIPAEPPPGWNPIERTP